MGQRSTSDLIASSLSPHHVIIFTRSSKTPLRAFARRTALPSIWARYASIASGVPFPAFVQDRRRGGAEAVRGHDVPSMAQAAKHERWRLARFQMEASFDALFARVGAFVGASDHTSKLSI